MAVGTIAGMVERVDVVICGGGVIGASIAYHLSLRGMRCAVVERAGVASGASGTAAGLLLPMPPAERETPLGRLALRSMARHREIARELDGDRRYGFGELASVCVALDKADVAEVERAWGRAPGAGDVTDWLTSDAAGTVPVAGGAQLDPGAFTRTLLEAACQRGCTLMEGDVQGIRSEGGAVTGVQVSAGMVAARRVVAAMGPWTREAEIWLRMPVPVGPLKGQILRYALEGAPEGHVFGMDGNYVVTKGDGTVLAGTTEEEAGFDRTPTPEGRAAIEGWVRRVAGMLDGAEPVEQTACLRPVSEDGLPLMGAAQGISGAFVATGHGRKGILLSAATGEAMADLVATGRCSTMDLSPFDPGRFRALPRGMR